jgi:hypothetical protein
MNEMMMMNGYYYQWVVVVGHLNIILKKLIKIIKK